MTGFLAELPQLWREPPRRWGHELHSLCSYMAMFPPAMPRVFIEWLSQPGDVVYDPFSGRGTTVLESSLAGRVALGSDANPLAWILTAAKALPPSRRSLQERLSQLDGQRGEVDTAGVPPDIRMLFSTQTLRELLWLRGELQMQRPVDRFLMAALLGGLHQNANRDGSPRGLTVAMPNTFAMAPGYVRRFIKTHRLETPVKDVLAFLRQRVERFRTPSPSSKCNRAWMQDARHPVAWAARTPHAKLIFTSPPYLGVMRYAKLNWIRHWLIGADHRAVDATLFSSGSIEKYLSFVRLTLQRCQAVLREDGFLCLVIGDVRDGDTTIRLGEVVARECADATNLRLAGIVEDRLPVEHKVSRIWGPKKGRATKTDRILVFAGRKARLPRTLPTVEWGTC